MMTRQNISKNKNLLIHLAILFGVFIAIVITNFPFSQWYTGWDNLHPEFNFSMNFSRALNAVWQSNQGLGTYGGHGYAATLLHTVFLWIISLIIPLQYLRSFFTFFTLLIGALGVFFLLKKLLLPQKTPLRQEDSFTPLHHSFNEVKQEAIVHTASLAAALYYMLNLATVQNYYIQLEAFIVHFAALPWLFYTLIAYLQSRTKRNLLLFAGVNILASVQGFIPPLFFVYMMLLGIFLLFYTLDKKGSFSFKEKIKQSLVIIGIVLAMNAYWFLPVVNYSLTRSGTYLNAYNNLSSTEDFIWKNKKFGNIQNVALLRGFIFEAIDADNSGNVFLIFQSWQQHLNNPLVSTIGYSIFGVILIGAADAIRKRSNWYIAATAVGLIFVFSLMATDSFPFSIVTQIMQYIPVIKQAFRVAFTKFSIALSFYYALGFGMGIAIILQYLKNIPWRQYLVTSVTIFFLIFFSFPIFQGNFLYQRTKLSIPSMYFELFNFFKEQDKSTRIANFPQGWNWGWSLYKWGYSGSGFLWYGIEQPILDRAFDVWGKYNEQYYWELAYAIFAEKYELIDQIVEKYQVSWIVFDENIIPYASVKSFIYGEKLQEYFANSPKYTLVKELKPAHSTESPILIYKVNLSRPTKGFSTIYQPQEIQPQVSSYTWTNIDTVYQQAGTSYSTTNADRIFYPLRELFSNRKPDELKTQITEDKDTVIFSGTLPDSKQVELTIPPLLSDETYTNIYPQALQLALVPQIYIGKDLVYPKKLADIQIEQRISTKNLSANTIEVRLPKISFPLVYNSAEDLDFFNHQAVNCNTLLEQINAERGVFQQTIIDTNTLHFESKNTENCYDIWTNLSQRYGYLISFDSKYIEGQPLRFAVIDHQSRKPSAINLKRNTEFNTNRYILPPMKWDGVGYNLHFNTISIGNTPSQNDLKNIQVRSIPYTFLGGIKVTDLEIPINTHQPVLAYFQSYDTGWKAYHIAPNNFLGRVFPFVFAQEQKNHVLLNNWANGWVIDKNNSGDYVFIFIPQLLENIGFLVGLISFIILLRKKPHNRI